MKSKILILAVVSFAACHGLAAAPTPTPPPTTPAPVPLTVNTPSTILTARALIAPAQLAANLNAVPATPQTLLQLFATFLPLPAGVTPDKIKSVTVLITPAGGANVTVQYVSP